MPEPSVITKPRIVLVPEVLVLVGPGSVMFIPATVELVAVILVERSSAKPVRAVEVDKVWVAPYARLRIVPDEFLELIYWRLEVATLVPTRVKAVVSEVGVRVRVVLEIAPVETLPLLSTLKYLVEPVLSVTSNISPVGEAVEVCSTIKPVVEAPVGAMVLVAEDEGSEIKQSLQEEPVILPQLGTPPETFSTWPLLEPIASFCRAVVEEELL